MPNINLLGVRFFDAWGGRSGSIQDPASILAAATVVVSNLMLENSVYPSFLNCPSRDKRFKVVQRNLGLGGYEATYLLELSKLGQTLPEFLLHVTSISFARGNQHVWHDCNLI